MSQQKYVRKSRRRADAEEIYITLDCTTYREVRKIAAARGMAAPACLTWLTKLGINAWLDGRRA